jgi:predicted DNA-binding protein (UPF0251 family)
MAKLIELNIYRKKTMQFIVYNPVVGGLIPGGPDEKVVQTALDHARKIVGDTKWKQGHSFDTPGGATEIALDALAMAGVSPVQPTGLLTFVGYSGTKDGSGNEYHKLRVKLMPVAQGDGDGFMLSLELQSEPAQLLIQRLAQVSPGEYIKVGATTVAAPRGNRVFVNHKVIVTNEAGTEIMPLAGAWKQAQEAADAAAKGIEALGIKDTTMINKAKAAKKMEFHKDLLHKISKEYVPE